VRDKQSKKIGGKHPGGPNYLQPEVHAAPSYSLHMVRL